MSTIANYIGELLLRQDHLIVPELGGFVARRIPAKFSDDGKKMFPPYKQLLFHRHLNLSDGILERYVAHRTNTDLNAAIQLINSSVTHWNEQLKSGQRVEIETIGFLYLDKENKIRFEQDRIHNLLLQSYGLLEILFKKEQEILIEQQVESVQQQKIASGAVHIELDRSQDIIELRPDNVNQSKEKIVLVQDGVSAHQSARPMWMKVAAAAVLLPFAFYSFWVPMTTDVLETKKLAFSDFNPFHTRIAAKFTSSPLAPQEPWIEQNTDLEQIVKALPEDALFYNFNYDDELIMPVRVEKKVEPLSAPKNMNPSELDKAIPSTSKQRIHLITGCFGQKENALNHIASLRALGFDAYLVDVHGGLHRVAALGLESKNELPSAASQLNEKEISFWTLTK